MGECEPFDRDLVIDRAHIQGLSPGALGRQGLNELAQSIMKFADVDTREIHGGVRSTGRISADFRNLSSPDVVLVLRRVAPITRPIDLALKLKAFGLRLRDAHLALDRIAADEAVEVTLNNADRGVIIAQFAELGVEAR